MSVGSAINYDNTDGADMGPLTCGWHPAPHIISTIDRLNFLPPPPLNVFLHPAWFAIVFEQPPATQTLLPPGDALPLLDEAAARTQLFSEHILYPKSPSTARIWPCLQFNSWGYGTDINESKMFGALAVAQQLGVEAFVLDFGWQDTLDDGTPCIGAAACIRIHENLPFAHARCAGNWTADAKKFPNGLKPLAAAAHKARPLPVPLLFLNRPVCPWHNRV